jgi:hypothetical protein
MLPEILSVINSRESGFSRILKSEGGMVPETLVEQSKTRNEHGSGTQIDSCYGRPDWAPTDRRKTLHQIAGNISTGLCAE